MELDKHYNLTVGLRIREVRGTIRGNQQGLESDIVIEMLHTMNNKSKSHAVRILREYVEIINKLQKKNNPDRSIMKKQADLPVMEKTACSVHKMQNRYNIAPTISPQQNNELNYLKVIRYSQ